MQPAVLVRKVTTAMTRGLFLRSLAWLDTTAARLEILLEPRRNAHVHRAITVPLVPSLQSRVALEHIKMKQDRLPVKLDSQALSIMQPIVLFPLQLLKSALLVSSAPQEQSLRRNLHALLAHSIRYREQKTAAHVLAAPLDSIVGNLAYLLLVAQLSKGFMLFPAHPRLRLPMG